MAGIALFLNGARGLAVLDRLLSESMDCGQVVVPTGFISASLNEKAANGRFQIVEAPDVNDPAFIEQAASWQADLFLIAGFPTIFKPPLIGIPRIGILNLHGGRVPEYRGGSPLNWQMINGEPSVGLSVLVLAEGIDDGALVAERSIPLTPSMTIADLHHRANPLFGDMAVEALQGMMDGSLIPKPQDDARAAYWHQRNDEDGRITPRTMTADQADRMIRALTRPYPGAFCLRRGRKVRLFAARPADFVLRGVPGRLCQIQGQGPFLICADRALLILDYLDEGDPDRRLKSGDHLD
ncbi:methionyl-tRNA formyltransferase [Magnetospira sp. QH-2]|uniref:methionyl-tRNA formyltransferase n=1 Tax=Magnetospira sp. (strain QH-2) TaxID=1288970 RepID=UPI0003E812E2|nr:formyltransferase family protein [Magnetospira sp. QH-2]CCQ73082.1 putative Methionyl-tRNA formyltransferase [Magnetospira sp. QH-2]